LFPNGRYGLQGDHETYSEGYQKWPDDKHAERISVNTIFAVNYGFFLAFLNKIVSNFYRMGRL
jgi:hypothetical protein